MTTRFLKTRPSVRGGRAIALALLGLATAGNVAASVTWKNIQLGGFASQGWLYSSENNLPTANKGGTWNFRELAVNASTTFGSHLRVGAQAFSQSFGEIGDDQVKLDWAVVDYNFHPAFGVRAGRVKYPKGLYGEALDLDVLRPFVFLPSAVYNPVLRDFAASFDGGMIYGTLAAGKGSVDYKLFFGDMPIETDGGVAQFVLDTGLVAPSGPRSLGMSSVAGGQLTWNPAVEGLRLVYSYSQFSDFVAEGPFAYFPAANFHLQFDRLSWQTVSAEYTWKDWVFATEWQRCDGNVAYSAPPLLPQTKSGFGWDGWYVSASRRLNQRFEVAGYYGSVRNSDNDQPGESNSQHDWSLSLRYDLNDHILFKVEGHYVDGTFQTFNTPQIPNPRVTLNDNTVVFAAKMTLSF